MNLKINIYQADNGAIVSQPDFSLCEVVRFAKKDRNKPIQYYIGKEIWAEIENDMNKAVNSPLYGYKLEIKMTRIEKDPYK